jgi:ABC-type polysaccharide/polyol phosphate transport system ATPase subunit
MSMQRLPAIHLQDVGKRFAFTPDTPQSVLESLISVASRRRTTKAQDLWAVRHVTFDVMPGQCVGIIGRNGSGKSTLLKIIARILQPTEGQVTVRGRVSALLELGAGFHQDLTGRENIYLNASVLGLNEEEIDRHFDSIVEFSELGEFIDMPVKHYSSGMYMRLGFSVAIHVDPDILIVDEILAVGDQSFQAKCIDRIMEMKRRGVTILIISHDLTTVRKLASHLVWMEKGEMRLTGPTETVAEQYKDHMFQRVAGQIQKQNESRTFKRWGTRQIEITDVRLLDGEGAETTIVRTGAPLTVEIHYDAHEPIEDPEFGLAIYRQDGLHVNGPNSQTGGLTLGVVEGSGVVRYQIAALPLLPAGYQLTAAIHDSERPIAYDYHEQAYGFRVVDGDPREKSGLLGLAATWVWEPGDIAIEQLVASPVAEPIAESLSD